MSMVALVEPMSFTKVTVDGLAIDGVVIAGRMAVINVTWSGNGAFTSTSWGDTRLATFSGWTCTRETHVPMVDNQTSDGAGAGTLHVWGNGVYFRTKTNVTISKGSWHQGCICVPVTPA